MKFRRFQGFPSRKLVGEVVSTTFPDQLLQKRILTSHWSLVPLRQEKTWTGCFLFSSVYFYKSGSQHESAQKHTSTLKRQLVVLKSLRLNLFYQTFLLFLNRKLNNKLKTRVLNKDHFVLTNHLESLWSNLNKNINLLLILLIKVIFDHLLALQC